MTRFLLLLALLALPGLAAAQTGGLALRIGTTGIGGDAILGVGDRFQVRASGTFLPYSTTYLQEDDRVDVSYEADAQLFTVAGLVDFYPFKNTLRLSTGLVYNASTVSALGTPAESYTTGGRTFSPEQLGTVQADLSHSAQIQPYLGLGFGNPLAGGRFGVMLDMGVFYTGSPTVTMEATEMLAPTAENAPAIQEALSPVTIYPAVSLAFSVRFGD
ncbi:MAG: hypothetical protein AAGF99_12090 [Bacteroidota bacterium]